MRILLDTNIFIPLEDSLLDLSSQIAEFNRLATGKHKLLIHPATHSDLDRDPDQDRKIRPQSRLPKYNLLGMAIPDKHPHHHRSIHRAITSFYLRRTQADCRS